MDEPRHIMSQWFNPHNSEYLLEVVNGTIIETEDIYKYKITSVVIYKAENMKKMREEMIKLNNVTYGCAAHYANQIYFCIR